MPNMKQSNRYKLPATANINHNPPGIYYEFRSMFICYIRNDIICNIVVSTNVPPFLTLLLPNWSVRIILI